MERIEASRIRLEASSICQLRCPICPNTQGKLREGVVGAGFLQLEDFKALLQRNPFVSEIELSNWGEVLLNPRLPEILAHAQERNIRIEIRGTNLTYADDTLLEALVRHNVRFLGVSIDGASQETYQMYRVQGDLHVVIQNIIKINEFKRQYNTPRPHLRWQFIVFGHNEHEIKAARKLAEKLQMTFKPKLNFSSTYSPVRNREQVMIDTGLPVTSRKENWGKFGRDHVSFGDDHVSFCTSLWTDPQINWDGKVLGCCVNYWGQWGGNAFAESLEDCLNSENLIYAREMLLGNLPGRDGIPCADCDIYASMVQSRNWIRMNDVARLLHRQESALAAP